MVHFSTKLYLWLRSERKLNNNTAVKFMHRFSSIHKMARDNGWVVGDPFKQQNLHLDKVDRGYLTTEEIAEVCGIHKEITFHVARHTFATTITLENGVPIETVSKMRGGFLYGVL